MMGKRNLLDCKNKEMNEKEFPSLPKKFIELVEDYKEAIICNPDKVKEIVGMYVAKDTEFDGVDSIKEKIKNLGL